MAAAVENAPAPVTNENNAPVTEQKETSNEAVTVFHDPENFNVKHPLMHEWTLWFTKPASGKVFLSFHSDWRRLMKTRWITGTTC